MYILETNDTMEPFILAKKLPPDVNKNAVFACNELDLKEVNVYGFDYDYTLADYKPSMDFLLYKLGRDTLIEKYKVSTNRNSLTNLHLLYYRLFASLHQQKNNK